MPHPTSRVLAMLEALQSRPRVTGAELAAVLAVDERTVRRYATTLAELGIPVTATRGRRGGYRLAPDGRVPPLLLTDNEAVAVAVGLGAVDHFGLSDHVPAAAVALAKLHRVLPARLAARLAQLQERLGIPLHPRPAAAVPAPTAVLRALSAATRERHRVAVSIHHPGWGGRLVELDPYGLVFHAGGWRLVGRARPGGDLVTVDVDRVAAVDVSDETFPEPEGFDPVAYVTGTADGGTGRTVEVEALLETDVAVARRRAPDGAELVETGGGVLLRAPVPDLEAGAALLAGFGCPFTVIRPDGLTAALAAYARRLAGYARRPAPTVG